MDKYMELFIAEGESAKGSLSYPKKRNKFISFIRKLFRKIKAL